MWVLCGIVGVLILAVVIVLLTSRPRSSRSGALRSAARTSVSGDARGAAPASSAADAAQQARYPGVARLQPDATGRIRIPLTEARQPRLPVEGVPDGWSVKEFTGHAVVSLVRDDGQTALRLTSARTSFALYRDVIVDLAATPWLTWSWKVTRLPSGGDVRSSATDDEAAQVYVIFPRWPAPLSQSDVLGYVWDTRAPIDTQITSPKAPNVRIIVLRSGDAGSTWRREGRDVASDYAAAFGRKAPRVGKIALMIDSNDTRTEAEALFGELAFSPAPGPPAGGVPDRPPVGKRS
jgi:hypothetical protein